MIINIVDSNYDECIMNEFLDIENNFKYLPSYTISQEASILIRENYNMQLLSEADDSFWGKFKAKIKSIIEAIKSLWGKFMAKVDVFLQDDVEWVKSYEKALRSAKIPDNTYTMFGYPNNTAFMNKLFGQNLIPAYNPEDSKLFDSLSSQDTFRDTYFKDFLVKDMNFGDGIKFMARGKMEEPEDYDNNQIATFIPAMIDYCKEYPKLINTLKKEKTNLENAMNKISRDIEKIKVPKVETKPAEDQAQNKPDNQKTEDQNTVKKEFWILAEGCMSNEIAVTERLSIFNEAPGLKVSGGTNGKQTTIQKDENGKVGSVPKESSESGKKEISDKYTLYMVEVFNFIGIRMSIVEEQFKTYLQVLRYIANDAGISRQDKKKATTSTKSATPDNKKDVSSNKEPRTLKGDIKNVKEKVATKATSFANYFK
ncbi:MAG: hypothetical protein ACRCXX_05830 [Cetobacterium sp.]|uniref:hypothetical protein n=1 Tax=Cetobacterium sp. TaxID=2071632 RepID=UPI003F3377D0